MNDENKTVTKITEPDSLPVLMKSLPQCQVVNSRIR